MLKRPLSEPKLRKLILQMTAAWLMLSLTPAFSNAQVVCQRVYSVQSSISQTPYVSIIMATYNRAHTIVAAIESVRAQTFRNWELIIVDDGSQDGTLGKVAPFLEKDSRIHYIKQENAGQAAARNVGIKTSRGHYVAFIDSDDQYQPDHLKYRVHLAKTTHHLFSYGGMTVIGDPWVPDKYNLSSMIHVNTPQVATTGTFFIERNFLVELGGFPNQRYAEDSALFDKAKEHGVDPVWIEHPTYIYDRTGEDSVTKNKAREHQ